MSGCFPLASCFGSPMLCASLSRPMSRGIARCHTGEPRASSLVKCVVWLRGSGPGVLSLFAGLLPVLPKAPPMPAMPAIILGAHTCPRGSL